MSKDATQATPKRRRRWRTEVLAEALRASGGMVHLAARQLGCAPSVIYNRMKRVESLRVLVDEQREEFLDIAETALKTAVIDGRGWAVCFTLKTIGKKRGYVERQEITGADGAPLQTLAELCALARTEDSEAKPDPT